MTFLRTLIISGGLFNTPNPFAFSTHSIPQDILTTFKAPAPLTTDMLDFLKRQRNLRKLSISRLEFGFDFTLLHSDTILPHLKDLEICDEYDCNFLEIFRDRSINILRLGTRIYVSLKYPPI